MQVGEVRSATIEMIVAIVENEEGLVPLSFQPVGEMVLETGQNVGGTSVRET